MNFLRIVERNLRRPTSRSAKPSRPPDLIESILGPFGKYQLWLCFLIFLSKFEIAWHQMAIIFLAPKTQYTCAGKINSCPCDKPEYNTTIFSKTMITEFNLICDRKWLASFSQTIFQLGTLIGSILFGMSSDRYGRKKNMVLACIVQVSFGVIAASSKTYEWFTFFRFVVGLSVGGTMVVGFVLMMEFIGQDYRQIVSALYQVPFNLGHLIMPFFGYVCRDDYTKFQLAISLPGLVLILYFFLLPETPRWLVAVKQPEPAIKIMEKVAKINNLPTENIRANVLAAQAVADKVKMQKGTIFDLFRTPNLRKNNICMAFNWLTCSYCFYGVSQYVGQLSGNVFWNVAASACVTVCGTLSSIPLMRVMGRKTIVIMCHIVCTTCLFILAFVPEDYKVISVACASIGVVSSFIVFVIVYLYTGELFPTVVRSAAVGFSSMAARIGSMLAPFVVDFRSVRIWLPPIVFAAVPFCAIFFTLLLPETKGCELTTTIEEGERFGKKVPPLEIKK